MRDVELYINDYDCICKLDRLVISQKKLLFK